MKKFISVILVLSLILVAAGCGNGNIAGDSSSDSSSEADTAISKTDRVLKIGTLKGPTGIGMAKLISDSENKTKYDITVYSSPEEMTSALITGALDAASVPVNLAALINNKTNGKYLCAAINTLGVLYLVENGKTVNSIKDLSGKYVITTGKGSTPEYIINHILEKNGVSDCNVEYKTEAAEVMTLLVSGKADIAILPEPSVTTALSKNSSLGISLDLTEEWEKIDDGSVIQGCLIISEDMAKNRREMTNEFLSEYEKSVKFVNENVKDASVLVEQTGIVPSAAIAEKAIPNCNIVFITGNEMRTMLDGFLKVLFNSNPASVGDKVPENGFYYEK